MKIKHRQSANEEGPRYFRQRPFGFLEQVRDQIAARSWLIACLELLAILVWTVFVTRRYLDFDPRTVPTGPEYSMEIQGHYVWTWFRQCGLCALWNGSARGGHPAFADLYGSVLHPLVIFFTLALGVVNGSKIALAGAFFIAGLAQWWAAKELQTGWMSRLFTAGLAVVAGNLAGRMSHGVYAVVMSTSAGALVIAALVAMGRRGSRRAAVALGVSAALVVVSGQGYIQVGLLFILPAVLLLVPWRRSQARVMMRRLASAGVLAGLLAGVFLAPLIHFLPQLGKALDPTYSSAQPIGFVPLNLVINELDLALKGALHMQPYPYLYLNYIGWLPALLAVYGLGGRQPAWKNRVTAFLAISTVLIFWIASASPLRWLIRVLPVQIVVDQLAAIRFPSLIAGLAVAPVLALSAIGLDRLRHLPWPTLRLNESKGEGGYGVVTLNAHWLLVIPLVMSLNSARAFGAPWLTTTGVDLDGVSEIIQALKTPDLQWVNPPFGQGVYLIPAIEQGLKLGYGVQPWHWADRPNPDAVLEAIHSGTLPGMTLLSTVRNFLIYQAQPGREYAFVTHDDQSRTVCSAHGLGGNIDVECNVPQAGLLTVKENSWIGWHAAVDGQLTPLGGSRWLSVNLPAGRHVVSFRYRPWDVLFGVLLTMAGIAAAAYLWHRRGPLPSLGSEIDRDGQSRTSVMGVLRRMRLESRASGSSQTLTGPFQPLVWPGTGPQVDWQRDWPELAVIAVGALLFGRGAPAVTQFSLLVAGLGMWWLGTTLEIGRLGRTWMGLTFAFAGVTAAAFGQGDLSLATGCAWIPWALACGLSAVRTRRRLYAALAAVALAFVFLGGNYGLTIAALLVLALSVPIVALDIRPRERPSLVFARNSVLITLGIVVLGCGLAAVQLILTLVEGAPKRELAALGAGTGFSLVGVLAALLEEPTEATIALSAYIGVMPALCLLGLPWAARRRTYYPLMGLGLLCAFALALAATGWLSTARLPVALLAWAAVGLIALAGAGLDAVWRRALANLTLRRVRVPEAFTWAAARLGVVALPLAALWAVGDLYVRCRPILISSSVSGNQPGIVDLLGSGLMQHPGAFWIGVTMSGASFFGILALIVGDHRARRRRIETEAIYREGVLQPESPLGLPDGTQVHVSVTPSGEEAAEDEAFDAFEPVAVQVAEPVTQLAAPAGGAPDRVPVLSSKIGIWTPRIAWVLFILGLVVYLVTRLWHIDQFPIFFFTDEATFALLAEELLTHGLRNAQGAFVPLYFEVAGNRWTPVLAVYTHLPAIAIFGKSIIATRTTSAVVTLLCPIAVSLILKSIFRARYWWAGALLVAVVPTWFLHSRTAFEWLTMAACYACFILSYLLYRTRSPKFLFVAILFGAATFYNHASGQLVMATVTLFLLVSDFRYHLKNWRTILLGLLLTAVLAIPALRLQTQHPGAMMTHLRVIDSYWFRSIPLIDKLHQFVSTYLYGLSPAYWFVPNAHDLIRHRMMGYGNLGFVMLPLVVIGALLCLWRVRSPAYRVLLLAALAAPAGAATAEVAITRMMAFVPPICVIAGLGLDLLLEWVGKTLQSAPKQSGGFAARSRLVYGALALVVFAVLSGASLWMLQDALKNGPTWYNDYQLYGMQYGARQLFVEAIPEYLKAHPDSTVMVSPNWANGTDTFIRFFVPKEQQFSRVQMHDVRYYMVARRELSPNIEFVMTPEEYEHAKSSGRFKSIDVDRTVPYPDGRVGFYFARLAYADNLDETLAKEREERRRPVIEEIELDGQSVTVSHSQFDMGGLPSAFDGDAFTVVRGLEANPLVFDFTFPQPRQMSGFDAILGAMDFALKISLYAEGTGEPVVYEQTFRGLPSPPTVEMLFDHGPESVSRARLEVLQLNVGDETHIHVFEMKFK